MRRRKGSIGWEIRTVKAHEKMMRSTDRVSDSSDVVLTIHQLTCTSAWVHAYSKH
jgi:hypothetical protein